MSHPNKGKLGDMGSDPRFYPPVNKSSEDIVVWANGCWCFRHELWEMDFMSDDYCVIYIDTPEYKAFLEKEQYDVEEDF